MIDFRYHLVSIVAVFLALAIGIVLGSSALRDPLIEQVDSVAATLRGTNEELRAEIGALRNQVEADQQLAGRLAPNAMAGRLAGERVAVVEAPGASGALRRELVTMIKHAGGTVNGRVALQQRYLSESAAPVTGKLAERLKPSGLRLPEGPARHRAATVLADALVGSGNPDNSGSSGGSDRADSSGSSAGQAVLSGFEDAGYLTVEETPQRDADLAVMIAPSTAPEGDGAAVDNRVLTDFAHMLGRRSEGAVLAGPTAAAGAAGLTNALRGRGEAARAVSTVDYIDTTTGQMAAVLALDAELEGRTGHYGIGPEAQGYLPPGQDGRQEGQQRAAAGSTSRAASVPASAVFPAAQ